MKNKISWRRIQTVPTRQQNISGLLKPLIRAPRSNHLNCKFSAPSIQNVVKFLLIVTTMFTIKNEVCFLKICSQYAKRKINNTVRVCSSQISSVRHLPHPSLLRRPFRQSTNSPTHPLRGNCSLLRSRRKFKSHRKEVIGNVEICRAKKLLFHVDRFCP